MTPPGDASELRAALARATDGLPLLCEQCDGFGDAYSEGDRACPGCDGIGLHAEVIAYILAMVDAARLAMLSR